ncbi:MAG: shikimate dehydrogenase [Bacteroidia bacterium]
MRIYGLIGKSLSHSFSEKYFSEKFRKETISDASYRLFPLSEIEKITDLLTAEKDFLGFNVTIPYKEKIIPFLDEIEESARIIGAVNTVKIEFKNEKKYLCGYNTDAYGFKESLKPLLRNNHYKALILGTGGASKAVEFVLKELGVECIFASRQAEEMKKMFPKKHFLSYSEINKNVIAACQLIINTTPLGAFPNVDLFPSIPYEFITSEHLLYDLIYNPAETFFLKRGKEKNALTQNGLTMLQIQAEKAWEIWNEKK